MNSSTVPIENKVVAGSWVGTSTGMLTWALTTFVPPFHHGIPADLQSALPYIVAMVGGTAAAYLAKHTPRTEETLQAAFQILGDPSLIAEFEKLTHTPAPVVKPAEIPNVSV